MDSDALPVHAHRAVADCRRRHRHRHRYPASVVWSAWAGLYSINPTGFADLITSPLPVGGTIAVIVVLTPPWRV